MGNLIKYTKGQKINNLEFLEELPMKGYKRMAKFKCYCQKEFISTLVSVTTKHRKSCGCLASYNAALKTHGLWKNNKSLHNAWTNITQRCLNSNHKEFFRYGNKGITICEEWRNNFERFYNWAMSNGYKKGLSLDRINYLGNYEPNNCRWTTPMIQTLNRSVTRWIEFFGRKMVLKHWGKEVDISESTLRIRIVKKNWPISLALTLPTGYAYKKSNDLIIKKAKKSKEQPQTYIKSEAANI